MDYKPDWDRVSKCGKYMGVYCPDHPRAWSTGYIHIHRIVAEMKIGRLLLDGEVVHHKDEDSFNNSPENLQVLASAAEHARIHGGHRTMLDLTCAECGKNFQRRKGAGWGNKNTFCSRRCNGLQQRRKQLACCIGSVS